jgi:hypothetical protein
MHRTGDGFDQLNLIGGEVVDSETSTYVLFVPSHTNNLGG